MTEIVSQRRRRVFTLPEASAGVLELAWGAATDIGRRRQVNEDSVLAMAGLYAVADGLGGHSAGDVASDAAVQRLATKARGRSRKGAILREDDVLDALVAAGSDIALTSRGSLHGSGTTVTGLCVVALDGVPALQVFNLGDSRVYAFHTGTLLQITRDHSYVQDLVDAGEIRQEEAETHPDANIITRALGFGELPEVDRWVMHPAAGMRFLACSDGLTRELSASSIAAILGQGESPQRTATALVASAVAAGGRDNVSVVVVDVLQAPSGDDAPEEAALAAESA